MVIILHVSVKQKFYNALKIGFNNEFLIQVTSVVEIDVMSMSKNFKAGLKIFAHRLS